MDQCVDEEGDEEERRWALEVKKWWKILKWFAGRISGIVDVKAGCIHACWEPSHTTAIKRKHPRDMLHWI